MRSRPELIGRHAVVVIGGEPLHPGVVAHLDRTAFVIAADSGYDHARAAGLHPLVLLGDLDSISESGLAAARRAAIEVEAHPPDKDATDTELALDRALAEVGPGGAITMVGGGGDRLDHLLASLTVLAQPRFSPCAGLTAWIGPALVHVVHGSRTIALTSTPSDVTVSLIPIGDVAGVTTTGLAWPLHGEALASGTSRGVSNLTVGGPWSVAAAAGVLAVVIPHAAELTAAPLTTREPQ